MSDQKMFHIVMYPWFAMGHLTAFLHISNKLAHRGHKISFFLPPKPQQKLEHFNLHPHLIAFITVNVPHVDGLPLGAETTADVPFPLLSHLATAMDLTRPTIQQALAQLKPDFVFFDFAHWMPNMLHELDIGIKCIRYCIISPATIGYGSSPERQLGQNLLTGVDLRKPPPSFPAQSTIKLRTGEARAIAAFSLLPFGRGTTFRERIVASLSDCDANAFKTCREMEGMYCDYVEAQFGKPLLLAGPVLPSFPTGELEEKWATWLDGFKAKTIIYCAFGSECIMEKDQFQELLLGFELTGLPFFAALKPPMGVESVEAALPEGFEERVKGRGFVYGGWVQQSMILRHPCVGCFVTHCGSGSLLEGLVNECQLVLLPNVGDQVYNARVMGGDLKVGVEVEKGDEDGLFSREGVCKAVKAVMDEESEVGKEVRANHDKWRDFLLKKGLEESYIDTFVQQLQAL